jgi:hypothetical protein
LAAARRAPIFFSFLSSRRIWLSSLLSLGPIVDFNVRAITASRAPATSGVRAMGLPSRRILRR